MASVNYIQGQGGIRFYKPECAKWSKRGTTSTLRVGFHTFEVDYHPDGAAQGWRYIAFSDGSVIGREYTQEAARRLCEAEAARRYPVGTGYGCFARAGYIAPLLEVALFLAACACFLAMPAIGAWITRVAQ